jgi:predicted MFS family arabinose efflux permease
LNRAAAPQLTAFQGAAVAALGAVRPGVGVTLALLAVVAFVNGRRSMVASALGMDATPEDRVAVMSMRATANRFGYLLGAGVGGLALAVGGFEALGVTLSSMFVTGALIHLPTRSRVRTPVAQQATA